jgi:hypothetical protein
MSTFFGDTSYVLHVLDGGVGNSHGIATFPATGGHNWVIDHAIWQHGDATGSADTDPFEVQGGAPTGDTTWQYMMILPNAVQPNYTSHAMTSWASATYHNYYNHVIFTYGNNYSGSGSISGTMYYGEAGSCNNSAGNVGIKNSILWNANPTANSSPTYTYVNGSCNSLNSFTANYFDPTKIHNNLVYGYSTTASNRWTSAVTGCGGVDCTSKGTPYDAPMTGTVPGANDVHMAPQFVWQQQGITAPGPRDWAYIRFGVAHDSTDTSTEAHFGNVFGFFRNAEIADTTTTAGMKGRIDDMFSWVYAEWASTNPALKAAADDGSDIGAAPVAIRCPTAYPAADVSGCNGLAQAGRPSDLGGSADSAGSN